MPIPLSTGLILRQGLDVVENYSRAQASLELPDSVFPVASIICTWHEGDREGLGKWFLPCQGEDLSLNPQMQGMEIEPCIFNPRSLVVKWEVEPGESQEAPGPVCGTCSVPKSETQPHSEKRAILTHLQLHPYLR